MVEYAEVELVVMVDISGDWAYSHSAERIADAWDDMIGGTPTCARLTTIKVRIPIPEPDETIDLGDAPQGSPIDATAEIA